MSLGFGSVGFFRRACASLKPPGEPLPAPSALNALAIPAPLMGTTTIRNLFLNKMPIAKTAPSKTTWKRSSRRHGRPLNCCRYCWIRRGVAVGTECHHYMSSSKTIQWDQGMRDFWDMTEAGALRALDLFLEEAVKYLTLRSDTVQTERTPRSCLRSFVLVSSLQGR